MTLSPGKDANVRCKLIPHSPSQSDLRQLSPPSADSIPHETHSPLGGGQKGQAL